MPFYKIDDMEITRPELGGAEMKVIAGEYMKVGIVTYQAGDGPPPHFHPNEEQFIMVMAGRMRMRVGEEVREIGAGDLIHIPRNAVHGIHIIEGPAVFFTCKSPAGDGDLNQDYHKAPEADKLKQRLESGT